MATKQHFHLTSSNALWNNHVLYGVSGSWLSHDMGLSRVPYRGLVCDTTRNALFCNLNHEIIRYNGANWVTVGTTGAGIDERWLFAHGGNLYAIAHAGNDIMISTDGGFSWTAAGSFLPALGSGWNSGYCDYVLTGDGVLHAVWWNHLVSKTESKCYLCYASTTDWGETWDNQIVLAYEEGGPGITPVTACYITTDGANAFIFAPGVYNYLTDFWYMIFASHDGGATWARGADLDYDPEEYYFAGWAIAVSPNQLHLFGTRQRSIYLPAKVIEIVSEDIGSGTPSFVLASEHEGDDLGIGGTVYMSTVEAVRWWDSEDDADRNVVIPLGEVYAPSSYRAYWFYWRADGALEQIVGGVASSSLGIGGGYVATGMLGQHRAGAFIM